MLETFGDYAKGECLHTSDGFVPVLAICHDPRQGWHLSQPTPVVFSFDVDRERHVGNVPFGPAVSQETSHSY